jgi:hypothetical protein
MNESWQEKKEKLRRMSACGTIAKLSRGRRALGRFRSKGSGRYSILFAFVAFSVAPSYACAERSMKNANEPKVSNRRRSRRAQVRTTVKFQCRMGSYGLGPDLASAVLDLSDSGARLIIKQPLEPTAEVEILISGYGMKSFLKRLGNIRWQVKLDGGQFCVGVEFQKRLDYRDWQNLASPN